MSVVLKLTPHDPLVARDGRPFGAGQGNRMRGLPWPLPSVVAGSFRTALVKAGSGDFSGDIPQRLMKIAVAGVFPVAMKDGTSQDMYLPAPSDAVLAPDSKQPLRVVPQPIAGGCDLPEDSLQPVMLSESQASDDFKPAEVPAWWPLSKMAEWLTLTDLTKRPEWFDRDFLNAPVQSTRDHVALEADRGAAEEGKIFASSNLHVTHLPRFGAKLDDRKVPFDQRYADIMLAARAEVSDAELQHIGLNCWHPLGGERRLIHWSPQGDAKLWKCPQLVEMSLKEADRIRMVLATPAIFKNGWKPGWLNDHLEGTPPGSNLKLKLIGVCNSRWKAVSGWSLAPPRGSKPIRRMVPAGSVYFFEVEKPGDAAPLADLWLQSVSDDEQERRDGFGLAIWGTWNNEERK